MSTSMEPSYMCIQTTGMLAHGVPNKAHRIGDVITGVTVTAVVVAVVAVAATTGAAPMPTHTTTVVTHDACLL